MSTDNKDDSNSTSGAKVEDESSKADFHKADESPVDRESKDNAKDDVKKENSEKSNEDGSVKKESIKEKSVKNDYKKENDKGEESDKEENEKDDSEEDEESEEEERVGMLDRPVQVSGCRARKQVQRLEVTFNTPTKEIVVPEGKGQKLGDIPIIEHQISKHIVVDLKLLHRLLYSKPGSANDTKKNIRKFSGFTFQKNSPDFEAKKASMEKLTNKVLKTICDILVLEKNKTKEESIMRILDFLMCPTDSGKKPPSKKRGSSQNKKKRNQKKSKSDEKKAKPKASEEEELIPSAGETSDINVSEDNDESDSEIKKKSKTKGKKKPTKVKTTSVKIAKPKSEPEKGIKRKKEAVTEAVTEAASEDENEEEKPPAKKLKIPEDDDIEKLIEKILENADLQEITMKKVIKEVFDTYPECDLMHKKPFIKKTIKLVINR